MSSSGPPDLVIRPRSAVVVLSAVAALLVAVHIGASALVVWREFDPAVVRATGRFNLAQEMSFPTVFSFVLLLLCSLLLTGIGVVTRRTDLKTARRWFVLAAVFLFLSFDEILALHEVLDRKVMYRISPTWSPLRASWGVPYAIALILLVASFWSFFWRLPRETRRLFGVSALLYVSGALAIDLIAGPIFEVYDMRLLGWIATTAEEILEMAGAITFIYALASYIGREFQGQGLLIASE